MDNTTPSSTSDNDPVAEWMLSLGYERSIVDGWRKRSGSTTNDKPYYYEFILDEQAAFFYQQVLDARPPIVQDTGKLRQQIEQMFASAWQDGVNHLNPKYLRRDGLFTDRVMQLITAQTQLAVDSAVVEARKDTARKILHRGWCIPEMEVQVEDYINALQQQQKDDGHE